MTAVFGVEFTDTVNLGGILIVVIGAALALAFTVRSNNSATWKDNFEAEKARNVLLEERLLVEREKKHKALAEVAGLEMTRDLTPVIKALTDVTEKVVSMQEEGEYRYGMALKDVRQMFADHDAHAQERHEALLRIASEIADKLNGEEKKK